MADRRFVLAALALACLGIYLFASAPPPLPDEQPARATIPVARLFAVLEAENDVLRTLWTREIVGAGDKVGLKFDEHWRDADVEAGPLPALFLRETARSLERNPVRLSLFLGSDFPINDANRFQGLQLERFRVLRVTGEPQFFFTPDTGLHTGMFSDVAVAEPCVDCHNGHGQSPKTDWRLEDVMGATTWLYPAEAVTLEQLIEAVAALHQAFGEAYGEYLAEVSSFAMPPSIGDRWPRDGYFLPTREVFMAAVLQRTAPVTMAEIAALAAHRPTDAGKPGDGDGR